MENLTNMADVSIRREREARILCNISEKESFHRTKLVAAVSLNFYFQKRDKLLLLKAMITCIFFYVN